MNPTLMRRLSLLGMAAPTCENLVEDAAQTNASDNTTDPEQAQQNVDFKAEIERLKQLKTSSDADAGSDTSGDTSDASDAPEDGADTSSDVNTYDTGAEDNTDVPADDAKADDADSEEAPSGEIIDDKKVDDGEDDEDAKPVKDAQAAVEALHHTSRALGFVNQAHETGVVRPYHLSLLRAEIAGFTARHGLNASKKVAATESLTTPSSDKVRMAVETVAEFVRELLAKLKEYYVKIIAWLKTAYRSFQESRGNFEKNNSTMMARIAYLGKQTIDQAKLDKAIADKSLQLGPLCYRGGNTLETVQAGIKNFLTVGNGVLAVVGTVNAVAFIDVAEAASKEDLAGVCAADTVISPDSAMKFTGASSVFGIDKVVHDNLTEKDGTVKMANLIGGYTYTWMLSRDAPTDTSDAYNLLMHYDFKAERDRDVTADFKPLATVQECIKVLELCGSFVDQQKAFEKKETELNNTFTMLSKLSENLIKVADAGISNEVIKNNCINLIAATPQAYFRLMVGMTTKHTERAIAIVKHLQHWVAESLNVIESAVVKK